jgi:hypothetical protein
METRVPKARRPQPWFQAHSLAPLRACAKSPAYGGNSNHSGKTWALSLELSALPHQCHGDGSAAATHVGSTAHYRTHRLGRSGAKTVPARCRRSTGTVPAPSPPPRAQAGALDVARACSNRRAVTLGSQLVSFDIAKSLGRRCHCARRVYCPPRPGRRSRTVQSKMLARRRSCSPQSPPQVAPSRL